MAFNGIILTTKGKALQSKVQTGTQLVFTKVKIGDGTLAQGQSLEALNDLINPKSTLNITGVAVLGDGTSRVRTVITNAGLAAGFYVREFGLFATDPDVGEILYAVANAGAECDYLPAAGGSYVVENQLDLVTAIGNATNITAVINETLVTATKQDISDHNNDPNAHGSLAAMKAWKAKHAYALGDICFGNKVTTASYKMMECTQGGTSAEAEPTWPAVGQEITDGTAKWKVCDMRHGTTIGRLVELVDVGGGKVGLPAVSGKLLTDISGVGIGTVLPFLATKAQPGWLALDTGALVSRTTYAELWAWVQSNAPLISDADWQTQAAAQSSVGAYSTGDGSTTFRLPRILDYARGGLAADVGKWQGDAIRNITGMFGNDGNGTWTGAFSSDGSTIAATQSAGGSDTTMFKTTFDVSRVVPVADENRPKTIKFLYCVKAFDAVTNQGLIDITALANDVGNLSTYVKGDFAIVYPNSGTAASPANLSINTRYVENNPFPGYYVKAWVEYYYNNMWATYDGNGGGGYGTNANYSSSLDKIIIQTGSFDVFGNSTGDMNPFANSSGVITSCKARLVVKRLGKLS